MGESMRRIWTKLKGALVFRLLEIPVGGIAEPPEETKVSWIQRVVINVAIFQLCAKSNSIQRKRVCRNFTRRYFRVDKQRNPRFITRGCARTLHPCDPGV